MSSLGNTMNPMGVRGLVRCPSFLAGSILLTARRCESASAAKTQPRQPARTFLISKAGGEHGNPRSLAVSPVGRAPPGHRVEPVAGQLFVGDRCARAANG